MLVVRVFNYEIIKKTHELIFKNVSKNKCSVSCDLSAAPVGAGVGRSVHVGSGAAERSQETL